MRQMSNLYHRPNFDDGKPCGKCGKVCENGKPDPCLGEYLPGIAHACCGHGVLKDAFCNGFDNCRPHESVTRIFEEGYREEHGDKYQKGYWMKRGQEAIEYMKSLKKK
jgi:hypothetical protein